MKTQLIKIAGLASYLIILGTLFNFNWILILNPKPFFFGSTWYAYINSFSI